MSNPYLLPDGPSCIQFSGGRSSAYMLWHILQAHDGQLPEDCHVLFQNTGREMPETLDFVQECSERWNVRVRWLEYDPEEKWKEVSHNSAARNGEPFEAIIAKRSYLPNRMARFCTADLKVRPSQKFMKAQGHTNYWAVLGIRADEPRRLQSKSDSKEAYTCIYPMGPAGVTRRDVAMFWHFQAFDLRLDNINGNTPLGNCDGCFLKSEANKAALARDYPDRAAWWAEQEAKMGSTFRHETPWKTLIEFVERQGDWIFDEEVDVLCKADLGGCFD